MAYNKTNWQNAPSTDTPINANNLNKIEEGIYQNSLKTDQVGDLSNLETTNKSTIVGATNENKENIDGIKGTILWTNSNPTSYFPGQNISLSSSDYDILEVFYITHVSTERNMMSMKFIKGFDANLITIPVAGGEYTRKLTRNSDTSYTFTTGYTYTSYMGGKTETANVCVPLYIVGYKTGLFS